MITVHRNLSIVEQKFSKILVKMAERGMQLTEIECQSEALLHSSEEFVALYVPWWKRLFSCCPSWWFSSQSADPENLVRQWVMV